MMERCEGFEEGGGQLGKDRPCLEVEMPTVKTHPCGSALFFDCLFLFFLNQSDCCLAWKRKKELKRDMKRQLLQDTPWNCVFLSGKSMNKSE